MMIDACTCAHDEEQPTAFYPQNEHNSGWGGGMDVNFQDGPLCIIMIVLDPDWMLGMIISIVLRWVP